MHGQRRILKRNRPLESKDKLASTLKPKKPKGDLKRYEYTSAKLRQPTGQTQDNFNFCPTLKKF